MKITSLALTEYVFLNITSYYQELFAAIIADENLRIIHKKKKKRKRWHDFVRKVWRWEECVCLAFCNRIATEV